MDRVNAVSYTHLKDEPTASFYDPALCEGIEVGKYIDYAWHGYVSEEEEVQIIEP